MLKAAFAPLPLPCNVLSCLKMALKSPKETVETIINASIIRVKKPWPKLMCLGFLAGAFVAFGGTLAIMLGFGVPDAAPAVKKLLFGLLFPIGLMFVSIGGGELFTGNLALQVPPMLSRKTTFGQLLANWGLSFVTNFAGAIFVAFFLVFLTGIFATEPWLSGIRGLAEFKVSQSFLALFLKGIGANWLVCMGVWVAFSAQDVASKIMGVWLPIMAFAVLGFEHSVANMFFIPCGIFHGANVTWGQFLATNMVPVVLGNIVGGALFVGAIYWYIFIKE